MGRTLGSDGDDADCASTTRCANLIQHIRIDGLASSHIRRILDLTAVIRSHVILSYEFSML